MAETQDTGYLSIGEVLGLLLEEFPDVTISKIRFLESQGLISPERTASGLPEVLRRRRRTAARDPHRAAAELSAAASHQGPSRRPARSTRPANTSARTVTTVMTARTARTATTGPAMRDGGGRSPSGSGPQRRGRADRRPVRRASHRTLLRGPRLATTEPPIGTTRPPTEPAWSGPSAGRGTPDAGCPARSRRVVRDGRDDRRRARTTRELRGRRPARLVGAPDVR